MNPGRASRIGWGVVLLTCAGALIGAAAAVPTPPASASERGLTVDEAVLRALANNRALAVERLSPAIARTFEAQAAAVFDPVLAADVSAGRGRVESRVTGDHALETAVTAGVGVRKQFAGGAEVAAELTTDRTWTTAQSDQHAVRVGITVTQALLRDRGRETNLVRLRQARLDTDVSAAELRGFAEALVAQVEITYWDYVLAGRRIEIFEESLKLAQQQLAETQQRIRVGDFAETELAAAQAEVALRNEALINARSTAAALRIRLLRLMDPAALASREIRITVRSEPIAPQNVPDPIADHLAAALELRPDLAQARLLVDRGELDVVRTRNGLLPKLDFFISLGRTGYADSFVPAVSGVARDGYDVFTGLALEWPSGRRDEKAQYRRAALNRRQAAEALRNLEDLAREDVELAHIELERALQQVDATAATLRSQQENLRAETAKFRVGKSTALLVAQVQRDLVVSQIAEVESRVTCLKAAVDLYRLEGSLLRRRGIAAVAAEP